VAKGEHWEECLKACASCGIVIVEGTEKLLPCGVSCFKVFRVLQDISLKIQFAVEHGIPKLHVQGIKEIANREQHSLKKPFPFGRSCANKQTLSLEFLFPERSLLKTRFLPFLTFLAP
jgi:hypothetical protein